jgi:radical SAM superfamily enzyme YgiQ (UPF0313 family)
MKTVLVMATALDKSIEHTQWGQPLGLAYIAACIRDISDVVIIDCEVDEQYTKTLMREINTDDDLIVGFSANTYTYPDALRLAKKVKGHNPNAHINFGGYHATPLADVILKNREYVDSVIRGDGEIPFRELVNALLNGTDLSKVGSLTYRNGGRIVSNPDAPLPDLDSLPYPARDLLPMEKCFDNLKSSAFSEIYKASKMVYINATRGCPNHCNYCCLFNRNIRTRKPEAIVDEFEYAIDKYKSDLIYLVGDNLNLNWKWFLAICEEVIKRKLDTKWMGVTVNPQDVNKRLIDTMEKSGCISTFYGFESASQNILKAMNRKYSLDKYKTTADIMRDSEIITCASFIIGYSGETEETLKRTIDFVRASNFERIFVSLLAPLPGTETYKKTCVIMPELKEMDVVPIEEAKRRYVEKFCAVDYQRLENVRKELADMSDISFDLY